MPVSGTPTVDLLEEHSLLKEEYGRLMSQLRWTHSMLAVLIEEQGGLVEVSKDVLENYQGELSAIKVYETADGGSYLFEVVVTEDE